MKLSVYLVILGLLIFSGCAAKGKAVKSDELGQYQARVAELERDLEEKNEEIWQLQSELEKTQQISQKKTSSAAGNHKTLTPKQIQTALKKAGFYKGVIDGKLGKNSKKAIIEFQKANGLSTDGLVGRKTSEQLRKYLK